VISGDGAAARDKPRSDFQDRTLLSERLVLREPLETDAPLLLAYHSRNAARFAPWGPAPPGALAEHLNWIVWRREQSAEARGRSFLAFDRAVPQQLAGLVNLDAIVREPQASAMLSYSIDAAYEGRGYAREAVAAVAAHAFEALGLARLVAHYDPANERSGALLRRLGFTIEAAASKIPPALRGLMRPQVMAALTRTGTAAAAGSHGSAG
jgi:ribosomal-protein-alanine N-acetyltransferase